MNTDAVYKPLLNQFYSTLCSPEINKELPSLFIPNVFESYTNTDKKIFYVGRDTNEWGSLNSDFANWNEKFIIERTSEFLENLKFVDYIKGNMRGFWGLVILLHLRLKGFEVDSSFKIDTSFIEKYKAHFDFGYGNTNSIELPTSIKNRDEWNNDKDYQKIKEASRPFDKLRNIVDAFSPKLIIITHWAIDESAFLEELDYEYLSDGGEFNDRFLHIKLTKHDTTVIWIPHPTYLSFYYKIDETVIILSDFIKRNNLL